MQFNLVLLISNINIHLVVSDVYVFNAYDDQLVVS